jgi:hypothetical protein
LREYEQALAFRADHKERGRVGVRIVEAVALHQDLDPYLSLPALAGYSGLSVRRLRSLLCDGLPHFRVGARGERGKRGAKILVRRSDFDGWMKRWRHQETAPPRDLDAIVEVAMEGVARRGNATRRGKARVVAAPDAATTGVGCGGVASRGV